MECEEVLIRLWEYLDQELGPKEAEAMRDHLDGCPSAIPLLAAAVLYFVLLARQRSELRGSGGPGPIHSDTLHGLMKAQPAGSSIHFIADPFQIGLVATENGQRDNLRHLVGM